jgi:hypothetical protein
MNSASKMPVGARKICRDAGAWLIWLGNSRTEAPERAMNDHPAGG